MEENRAHDVLLWGCLLGATNHVLLSFFLAAPFSTLVSFS